jgi:hypothetical protein
VSDRHHHQAREGRQQASRASAFSLTKKSNGGGIVCYLFVTQESCCDLIVSKQASTYFLDKKADFIMIVRVSVLLAFTATNVGAFTPTIRSTSSRPAFHTQSSQLRMADGDEYDFDVAIIGCGVGGHGAALHARGQGLKTAVFSGNDVGGTCVNRGCVPSKALLAASGRVRDMKDANHLKEMGITVEGEVQYERADIAAHAKNLANRVKGNLENSLVGLSVDVIEGRGSLTGNPHEVKDQSTGKVYKAKVRLLKI